MTSFRVRNVLCEYSLAPPNQLNSSVYQTRSSVPSFHIFGITETGKKACVHIHGVLPYMVLRVGGAFTPRVEYLMRSKINRLVQREMMEKRAPGDQRHRTPDFVYRIEEITKKSLYGYHPNPEPFAKVYFTNPYHCTLLFRGLGREVAENPGLQPFEAHLPFTLQFFIDHSLFGMDLVHLKSVQFRLKRDRNPTDELTEGLNVEHVLADASLLSPLDPVSSSWVECDAFATDIENAELHQQNVHSSNPGLEYIWREEAARCQLQKRPLEDTFNQYAPRPYQIQRSEKDMLTRLKETARNLRQRAGDTLGGMDLTQRLNDTVSPDNCYSQKEQDETEHFWSQEELLDAVSEMDPPQLETAEKEEGADEETDGEAEANMTITIDPHAEVAEEEELTTSHAVKREAVATLQGEHEDDIEDLGVSLTPCTTAKRRNTSSLPNRLPFLCRDRPSQAIQPSQTAGSIPSTGLTDISMDSRMNFGSSPLERTVLIQTPTQDDLAETDGEISEVSHFSVASLEVFAHTAATMPDPTNDPILAVSLCIVPDVCRSLIPSQHVFITTISEKLLPDGYRSVENEHSIIDEIVEIINRWDPDMLVGYDIDRLSWGYLAKRSDVIGYSSLHTKLSRYANDVNAWRREAHVVIAPNGRLMEAVWRAVRRDLQLRCYDRGTACLSVLKKKIPMLDDRTLSRLIDNMDRRSCTSVVEYLQRISFLNVAILAEMDFFLRNAEMARVYGIQFHEVWTRGSQLRVESMLLRLARCQGYVAPSVTPSQRNRMCAPEQLQLILEPQSKVYYDPVIVLDFQSLYPSMVIAYNYCYSTLIGKVAHLAHAAETGESSIELGSIAYTPDPASLVEAVASRQVHCSPLSSAFVKKAERDGAVPTLLREVLGARIMIKTAMKHTKSKRLKRILDARQLALKLVANVTYGYTSANHSGRMPCVEAADAILGKGRETLERAIDMVQKGSYGGSKVIYGDTDSMFVLVPGATLEQAFAIGRRIAADVTNDNPAPVVLKLEKVYVGCVLETKKRYAGWMFESETDEPRLHSKGIETIRRDTCPIVAKILERSLELIFQRRFSTLYLYLDAKLSRLDQLPYTDFIFSKEYRGGYAANAPVPQKKVAMALAAKSPAHVPLSGERIQYIVVDGFPNATVISCVRSVQQFIDNRKLKVNASYYARSHILAALRRVTDLLPLTLDWRPNRPHHCFTPDCYTIGAQPWCISCTKRRSAFQYATLSAARDERLLSVVRVACRDCQRYRDPDTAACANHRCVIKQVWVDVGRSGSQFALSRHNFNR